MSISLEFVAVKTNPAANFFSYPEDYQTYMKKHNFSNGGGLMAKTENLLENGNKLVTTYVFADQASLDAWAFDTRRQDLLETVKDYNAVNGISVTITKTTV